MRTENSSIVKGLVTDYKQMFEELAKWWEASAKGDRTILFDVGYVLCDMLFHGYTIEQKDKETAIFFEICSAYEYLLSVLGEACGEDRKLNSLEEYLEDMRKKEGGWRNSEQRAFLNQQFQKALEEAKKIPSVSITLPLPESCWHCRFFTKEILDEVEAWDNPNEGDNKEWAYVCAGTAIAAGRLHHKPITNLEDPAFRPLFDIFNERAPFCPLEISAPDPQEARQ
jgi:hypothetical protein